MHKFCVTVGNVTRTAGILIHSQLKALDINPSWPSNQLWLYIGLIGSLAQSTVKGDELSRGGPCCPCESFFFFFLMGTSGWMFLLVPAHSDSPGEHTHTRLTALFLGLPRWASTRKGKPIWILLKQETVSGSGISWAICKSAPHSRQITAPAPHHSVFYRPVAFPATQPTASKLWR